MTIVLKVAVLNVGVMSDFEISRDILVSLWSLSSYLVVVEMVILLAFPTLFFLSSPFFCACLLQCIFIIEFFLSTGNLKLI